MLKVFCALSVFLISSCGRVYYNAFYNERIVLFKDGWYRYKVNGEGVNNGLYTKHENGRVTLKTNLSNRLKRNWPKAASQVSAAVNSDLDSSFYKVYVGSTLSNGMPFATIQSYNDKGEVLFVTTTDLNGSCLISKTDKDSFFEVLYTGMRTIRVDLKGGENDYVVLNKECAVSMEYGGCGITEKVVIEIVINEDEATFDYKKCDNN